MVSLSQVLQWKYGPVANTKQKYSKDNTPNPEMIISNWRHPNILKPSKEQLEADFAEYEIYMEEKEAKKKAINDGITALKEKIKDLAVGDITDRDALDYLKLLMKS